MQKQYKMSREGEKEFQSREVEKNGPWWSHPVLWLHIISVSMIPRLQAPHLNPPWTSDLCLFLRNMTTSDSNGHFTVTRYKMELLVIPNNLVYLQVSVTMDGNFTFPMVHTKTLGVFLICFNLHVRYYFGQKILLNPPEKYF